MGQAKGLDRSRSSVNGLPLRGLNLSLYTSSMVGIKNARVFPELVLAALSTSLLASKGGRVRC